MPRTRTTAADLASFFGASGVPIYLLDEDRRIVFCNAACARWLGVRMADLLGKQCAYHSPEETDPLSSSVAGLCPPPKTFSGQVQTAVVCRTSADGEPAYRRGHFLPLFDGQDESASVLAILEPYDCAPDSPDGVTPLEQQLHEQLRRLRRQRARQYSADSLLGRSPAMVRARAQIELAARSNVNVLVLGPRGAGKDHVAQAIHYSQAQPGSLVPLDCAVLEANLIRSALRTLWAKHSTPREVTSTLLLEDVDQMPIEAQADLREAMRSGSWHMRIVSTSCKPLDEAVGRDAISQELACALSTLTIEIPSLTARAEDIPLLAQAHLEQVNAAGGKQVGGFSPSALDLLVGYAWPNNVDELAAAVRESHEHAAGGEVNAQDLPHRIHLAADASAHPKRVPETIVLEEFLTRVERELIERAMRRAKGNKSKAAKLLGLTRPRLYRRLVQLGMEQPPGDRNG